MRCKFCFSITHTSAECEWAPDQESTTSGTQSQQQALTQSMFPYLGSSRRRRVCLLYNRESTPGCSFPNSKFEHICSLCADDPHATDKRHKAVMCPHHSTPGLHPMASHPRKNGTHLGLTTDLSPTTAKYPQLRTCDLRPSLIS